MEPKDSLPRPQDCHLSISCASSIQSTPTILVIKIHFHIILPSMSRSSQWFLVVCFPHQNPIYISLLSHECLLCSYSCK